MAARCCSICLTRYPLDDEFVYCYSCENYTDKVRNAKAIPLKVARSKIAHDKFDIQYAEHDANADPKRLDPRQDSELMARYPDGLEPDNIHTLKKARAAQATPPRRPR